MRAIVQRVSRASVAVGGEKVSEIGKGFLVLLGVGVGDRDEQAAWIVRKIAGLRIFEDAGEHMNLSLDDVSGKVIVVSQFTLYADCRKGNRPSFVDAAPAEEARRLYELVVDGLKERLGADRVGTGVFQTHMEVELVNDGPVTIMLEPPA